MRSYYPVANLPPKVIVSVSLFGLRESFGSSSFVSVISGPIVPTADDGLEIRGLFNLYTKRAMIAVTTMMTTPATIPPIAPAVNGGAEDGEVEIVAGAVNLTC